MTKIKTKAWDPAEYLTNSERIAAYIDAALEDGDPQLVAAALGDVARARGMGEVAEKVGMSRTSLYRALSPDSRAEFSTILKVMGALGVRMRVDAQSRRAKAPAKARVRATAT
jgi:probable addiction module antidote protein